MSTISTQLRNFKEPSREQLLYLFFAIPELPITSPPHNGDKHSASGAERMDINAVLSFGEHGVEDSYVSLFAAVSSPEQVNEHCVQAGKLHLIPPYLAFSSLDRKSVRFTLPLSTVRRVERLNARAGVYALSLSTWHGMKIVSRHQYSRDILTSLDRSSN